MYKKIIIILLSYVIFLLAAMSIDGVGYSDWMFLTISFVVFMFAIFLAFTISNRRHRIISLRKNLREIDASLTSLYFYSKNLNPDISRKILELIDIFLIATIEYKLKDYYKSEPQFIELYEYVNSLKTKNTDEFNTKVSMLSQLEMISRSNKVIQFTILDQMQPYEWLSIILLSFATIFCLIYINDRSIASLILIPILETVITIIFITIYDLDSLRWQEQNWIWQPLSILFTTLKLLPYFPNDVISKKRVSNKLLTSIPSYRVAHYKSFCPDNSDKIIEIVHNK